MIELKNIIQFNGQRYDADTGELLDKPAKKLALAVHHKRVMEPVHVHKISRSLAHHRPQKSHTLRRSGLKKPEHVVKAHSKKIAPKDTPLLSDVVPSRAMRAKHTPQSGAISHFSSGKRPSFVKRVAVLPVVEPKEHHHSEPIHHAAHNQAKHHQPLIHKATAKHQIKHPAARAHLIGLVSATLAASLIIAFWVYQNIPSLQMRVASGHAGFSAHLPSYQPNGFVLNSPIAYGSGKVRLNFKTKVGDSYFEITQSLSNWSPEALFNNFVASAKRPYQTFQDQGKTIYFYDASAATWVDKGIWYQIEGNSGLSTEQLLKIAGSM